MQIQIQVPILVLFAVIMWQKTQQENLPITKLLKQTGKDASFVAAYLTAHKIGRSAE